MGIFPGYDSTAPTGARPAAPVTYVDRQVLTFAANQTYGGGHFVVEPAKNARPQITNPMLLPNKSDDLYFGRLLMNATTGEINFWMASTQTENYGANTGQDFSSHFETRGRLTIAFGGLSVTVQMGDEDTPATDEYDFTPVNAAEVAAMSKALAARSGSRVAAGTITLSSPDQTRILSGTVVDDLDEVDLLTDETYAKVREGWELIRPTGGRNHYRDLHYFDLNQFSLLLNQVPEGKYVKESGSHDYPAVSASGTILSQTICETSYVPHATVNSAFLFAEFSVEAATNNAQHEMIFDVAIHREYEQVGATETIMGTGQRRVLRSQGGTGVAARMVDSIFRFDTVPNRLRRTYRLKVHSVQGTKGFTVSAGKMFIFEIAPYTL